MRKSWDLDRVVTPNVEAEGREKLKKGGKRAVKRAMDWAREE